MSKPLAGKVALVTGGSRGIGAASAVALAEQGADVAISYVASASKAEAVVEQLQALGVKAVAFQADQADSDQVAALVNNVVAHFGKLDILVNNAGVFQGVPLSQPDVDLAAIEHMFAVNVKGVAAAVRTATPLLQDGGRIISIGSVAADGAPFPGLGDYSATKAAVASYTRAWARELGQRGITVNNVQPGPIDTDMGPGDGPMLEVFTQAIALKRLGKAEEVGATVAFLASPAAAFITGATINVDGGISA